ncbi:MAG: protein kinase [Acidobacteria bacterium]|nr:protein kinase [Acidobacteriota bacterium]
MFALLISPYDWSASFRFESFSVLDGLSHNDIYAIKRDRLGFLWVATADGLNRFDGQKWTLYRHAANDPYSLPDSYIQCLEMDASGRLWVGTQYGGLCLYDPDEDRFETKVLQNPETQQSISNVTALRWVGDQLWVGTEHYGLFIFDQKEQKLIRPEGFEAYTRDKVECISPLVGPYVYVGTRLNGLMRLDYKKGGLSQVFDPQNGALPARHIWSVWVDSDGTVWVGTKVGLLRKAANENDFQRVQGSETLGFPIESLARDTQHRLWVGTRGGGLFLCPEETELGCDWRSVAEFGFPEEFVTDIYADNSGLLWIGTYQGGLYKLGRSQEGFDHYLHAKGISQRPSVNKVRDIEEDGQGRLWMATLGGVSMMDANHQNLIEVDLAQWGMDEEAGLSLLAHPDGGMLVALDQGQVWLVDKQAPARRLDSLFPNLDPKQIENVATMIWDHHGRLWLGSLKNGLTVLDPATGQVDQIEMFNGDPLGKSINVLFADSQHRYWVSSEKGLHVLDSEFQPIMKFSTYVLDLATQLPSNGVFAIAELDQTLWLGTSGGLCQIRPIPNGKKWPVNPVPLPGIKDLTVYGLIPAQNGMWLGTNQGLVFCSPHDTRIKHYTYSDGIQGDLFSSHAAHKGADGRLYFGGSNGVTAFFPDRLHMRTEPPSIALSEFQINQKTVPLHHYLKNENLLLLQPDQNFLHFRVAALDLVAPEKNVFRAKLHGWDEDWFEFRGRCDLDYRKLGSGTYQLEVYAANDHGFWATKPYSLNIQVLPYFYQSWWFRGLILLFTAIGGHYSIRFGRRFLKSFLRWRRAIYIGPYRVLETIGKGGMGTVYKAIHSQNKRQVAIKIFDLKGNESRIRRFSQESLACERIDHPNVIKIYDRGQHEGRPFYCMELCEGKSLRQCIQERNISTGAALMLYRVLLETIRAVHTCGVLHRDLKPDNIMILNGLDLRKLLPTPDSLTLIRQNTKILDFGLAKLFGEEHITKTGDMLGTVSYLPPEYLAGEESHHESFDFYALGIILYEMLTARAPYEGNAIMEIIFAIFNKPATPPAVSVPHIPGAISEFCLDIIQKDVHHRLTDPDEILAKLDEILGFSAEEEAAS